MAEITLTPLPGTDEKLFKRFMKHVSVADGCWEWTGGMLRGGYGRLDIGGKHTRAHRIAYLIFRGSIPENTLVCHHCDNPPCVNPAHLWLGTNHENILDSVEKGRFRIPHLCVSPAAKDLIRGERNGSAKLTGARVIEIRAASKAGMRNYEISREFRIPRSTVADIVSGRNWRHV